MKTLRVILIKTCSEPMQRNYTKVFLLECSLINSMHSLSTTPLTALSFFPYLTAKEYYRLFEFLNDTLVHMQPEVLNIGTFKMFKTKL